jgi:hypothetical protein
LHSDVVEFVAAALVFAAADQKVPEFVGLGHLQLHRDSFFNRF